MTSDTSAPVATCYACGQTDDHPKFTHIVKMSDASLDQPYHYDCIASSVKEHHGIDNSHPMVAAALAGVHGSRLRKVGASFAVDLAAAVTSAE